MLQKSIDMTVTTDMPAGEIDPLLLAMIRDEREKALSAREWQFRLRGYGYAIKSVDGAQILTRLPRGIALGVLPTDLN